MFRKRIMIHIGVVVGRRYAQENKSYSSFISFFFVYLFLDDCEDHRIVGPLIFLSGEWNDHRGPIMISGLNELKSGSSSEKHDQWLLMIMMKRGKNGCFYGIFGHDFSQLIKTWT